MFRPRAPMIQEQPPLDPTLHLPIFPLASNLKFHTTNILDHQQHVLLDNLWAIRANYTNFLHVMTTLNLYFQNQNITTYHIIPYNPTSLQPLSKVFSLPIVKNFITQDHTIKLMETEIEVKKIEIEELTRKIQKSTYDYYEMSQYVV